MENQSQKINVLDKSSLPKIGKEIPGYKGSNVVFYLDFIGEDYDLVELASISKDDSTKLGEMGMKIILDLIADWNLYDKEDNKIPIDEENFKRLPVKIQLWLLKQANEIIRRILS